VIAALRALALVRDRVSSIEGGPLVSLAIATAILPALTDSAPSGLTIALDTLGKTYLRLASQHCIGLVLLHRVAVTSVGTLNSGAVVTLLAVCGVTHRDSCAYIFVVAIIGGSSRSPPSIVLRSNFGLF